MKTSKIIVTDVFIFSATSFGGRFTRWGRKKLNAFSFNDESCPIMVLGSGSGCYLAPW